MNEKQLAELKSLKTTLRCLVVSNPIAMDTNSLRREYKLQLGENVPFFNYGYKDIAAFLKERCSDIFTFSGMPTNPTLTPIITKDIMHIDKMISRQKPPSNKTKRARVYETQPQRPRNNNSYSWERAFAEKKSKNSNNYTDIKKEVNRQDKKYDSQPGKRNGNTQPFSMKVQPTLKGQLHNESFSPNLCEKSQQKQIEHMALNSVPESIAPESEADSGTHTSSSGKSERGHKLFVSNLKKLISEHPKGIWSVELQGKYRDHFGVELDYERRGYNCLVSMCVELTDVFSVYRPDPLGDWLLLDCLAAPPLQEKQNIKQLRLQRQAMLAREVNKEPETDDALPGIDFDPSMYPSDCLHFLESVPTLTLPKELQQDMLEVIVAEVADPSHFWFQLRGSEYSDAMEVIMDQMTDYYRTPEGAKRNMAAGAVRVGQYCAASFEGDWHRSVIVQILSKGMVKVRHIDYGTVDSVCSEGLRYLPRVWSHLPAQALRGQLAKVAPANAAARWPHSTARHFLYMVREKPLIAEILHVDPKEQVVSMILVDTSSSVDIFINDELVTHGLAEPYFEEELSLNDMPVDFLLPSFDAFENGRAFNYGEKTALLNKGICPEEVQDPTGVCGKPRKDASKNLLHRREQLSNRGIACPLSSYSDLGSSLESLYCNDPKIISKSDTPQEEPQGIYLSKTMSPNKAELGYHQLPGPAFSNNLQFQPQCNTAMNQMNMLEYRPLFYPNQQNVNYSSNLPLPLPCNANPVNMSFYPVHNSETPSGFRIFPPSPNSHSMHHSVPYYFPHFNTNSEHQNQSPPITDMSSTPKNLRMITKKLYQGFTENNTTTTKSTCNTLKSNKQPEVQKSDEHNFLITMPPNVVSESTSNMRSSPYNYMPTESTNNSHTGSPNSPGFEINHSPSSGHYVIPQKRNSLNYVTSELAKVNIALTQPSSPSEKPATSNFDFDAPPLQLSSLDLSVLQTLISTNPTLASDFLANIRAKNNISGKSATQCAASVQVTTKNTLTVDDFSTPAVTIPSSSYTSAEVVTLANALNVPSLTMINKPPGF